MNSNWGIKLGELAIEWVDRELGDAIIGETGKRYHPVIFGNTCGNRVFNDARSLDNKK